MYIILAYLRELEGRAIPSEKAQAAVKIAVLPSEQDFIMHKTHISELNPKGYLLQKGDFVQISGKPGRTRETPIRGYAFTEQPTMLSPKQKPGR